MEVGSHTGTRRMRAVWLGVGLGLMWGGLSIVGAVSSASADDGSGLLGGVSDTVASLSDALEPVTRATGDVVGGVGDVVSSTTKPVTKHLPEPVREPVEHIVDAVPDAPAAVVEHVDRAVTPVADETLSAVSDVVDDGVVDGVTAPVLEVVDQVPVVGDVVQELGLTGAVDELAADLDDTLGTVVGSPGDVPSVLPPLPTSPPSPQHTTPALPPVDGGTSPTIRPDLVPATPVTTVGTSPTPTEAASSVGGWAYAAGSSWRAEPAPHAASVAPSDGGAVSPSEEGSVPAPQDVPSAPVPTQSGGAGPMAALAAALDDDTVMPTRHDAAVPATDDQLPSTPTYDTDTSPD